MLQGTFHLGQQERQKILKTHFLFLLSPAQLKDMGISPLNTTEGSL